MNHYSRLTAGPSSAHLVAFFAAIYFTLFSGLIDAALLAFFVVIRQRPVFAAIVDSSPLDQLAKGIIGTSALAAFLLFRLFRSKPAASRTPRRARWRGPGRVLLFPGSTSHSRTFPQKHSFSYSYLTVGIPVGFEGNVGGLVSVGVQDKPGKPGLLSWLLHALPVPKAWFTVDAGDYLQRGKSELGLRGKLDEYLQTKGHNPATYPYAYLVTAARFLGYHFNPISFWYLYDADKDLAAMILEVNNTFDERRMYFLLPDDMPERKLAKDPSGSGDRRAKFKQSWPKDFHVSPFNSRQGSYTFTTCDPLSPCMQGTRSVSNTIRLVSSNGHSKLVASLIPDGPPIDPYTMTAFDKFWFLASWWWVGLLTVPRIFQEAFVLFFRRKLHLWFRPEPLKESISRRASSTEQQLESIFKRYLQHLVEQSDAPLAVKYIASGLTQDMAQLMRSPAARRGTGAVYELEFQVLSPEFYKRFVYYARDLEAFVCEVNESRTIWVSAPELLPKLALKKRAPAVETDSLAEYVYFKMIENLRVRPARIAGPLRSNARRLGGKRPTYGSPDCSLSSMDVYVLAHESARTKATYSSCVLKLFLADRISFGFMPLLGVQRLFLQGCVAWFLSSAMGAMLMELYFQHPVSSSTDEP